MALSGLFDTLREAGSKALTLAQGQAWLESSVAYVSSHPWTSLGVATSGAYLTWRIASRPSNLPPGPFCLPIIGALDYIREDVEFKLREMRPTYGDIMHLKLPANELVVLTGEKVIREVLLQRGEEFSKRQRSRFMQALTVGLPKNIHSFSHEWKDKRTLALKAFKQGGFDNTRSMDKVHKELDKLEARFSSHGNKPFTTKGDFCLFTSSLFSSIFFDKDLPLSDSLLAELSTLASEFPDGSREGQVLCDLFLPPPLHKIICRKAILTSHNAMKGMISLLEGIVQEHRENFDPEDIKDFIDYHLANTQHVSNQDIASNILMFLPDGVDSLASIIVWILFFLAKHQEHQRKLQFEIDDVIGRDRHVLLSDKTHLPFLEAVVLEALRCSDTVPNLQPRLVQKDTELQGFRIPKGVGLMVCMHTLHYDPDIFPDPCRFDPTRFIDGEGKLDRGMTNHVMPFGLGRRMCMGEQYSKTALFFTLCHLAQKFTVTFDPSQPEPPSPPEIRKRFIALPPPHKLCFTLR